jgi:hypothetical protein
LVTNHLMKKFNLQKAAAHHLESLITFFNFYRDVSMVESLKLCYENFIKHATTQDECPICERGLDKSQLHKFVDTVI